MEWHRSPDLCPRSTDLLTCEERIFMTQAQIDAARRNGAKSNGPKTPEGKAISSGNAVRHGMTAKAILLTNENHEAYTKLAEAYYEKFQHADDVERDLVDEM